MQLYVVQGVRRAEDIHAGCSRLTSEESSVMFEYVRAMKNCHSGKDSRSILYIASLTADGVREIQSLRYTVHTTVCQEMDSAIMEYTGKTAEELAVGNVVTVFNVGEIYQLLIVAPLGGPDPEESCVIAKVVLNGPCNPNCCSSCAALVKSTGGKLDVCAGCQTARYCSVECQKAHWKQHKADCRALQMQGEIVQWVPNRPEGNAIVVTAVGGEWGKRSKRSETPTAYVPLDILEPGKIYTLAAAEGQWEAGEIKVINRPKGQTVAFWTTPVAEDRMTIQNTLTTCIDLTTGEVSPLIGKYLVDKIKGWTDRPLHFWTSCGMMRPLGYCRNVELTAVVAYNDVRSDDRKAIGKAYLAHWVAIHAMDEKIHDEAIFELFTIVKDYIVEGEIKEAAEWVAEWVKLMKQ